MNPVFSPLKAMFVFFMPGSIVALLAVLGLFVGGVSGALIACGGLWVCALMGWTYFSFLMGHLRPRLWEAEWKGQVPLQVWMRRTLFMVMLLGPSALGFVALWGADELNLSTNTALMLCGGWMGINLSFWCETANEYHLFPLPATFLLPDLGALMHQIRWGGTEDDTSCQGQLHEWSTLARICQHPATAPILLNKGEAWVLSRLLQDGRPQDRQQAFQRLCKQYPEEAIEVVEDLSPQTIADLGEELVQDFLQDPNPTVRQKAIRAGGFLEALST